MTDDGGRRFSVRQQIIELLTRRPMDARELSAAAGVREKEVYAHLDHIVRSVSARGGTFRMEPASCRTCGFVFRNRRRMTRPSRCPRCRSQRISAPAYAIET